MKTLCSKISNFFGELVDRNVQHRTTSMKDGTMVTRPYSFAWLYALIFATFFIFFWIFIVSAYFQTTSLYTLWLRRGNLVSILGDMVANVEFDYFPSIIEATLDTIKMAVVGTAIGAALALPVAFLASSNIVKSKFLTGIIKFILSLIRTIPTLMFAYIMTFIFNFGTFAGTLALLMFTFTIAAKMLYEIIETVDLGSFVAVEAMGASKVKAFWTAILPQILGAFASITLYTFELNIRASAILGFVGAGGIGLLLNTNMGTRQYGKVSLMLIVLLVIVLSVENISRHLRKRFN